MLEKVETYDYEDERGWIRDLVVQPDFAITEIFTKAAAVRGNHVHHNTTQWTYILRGRLKSKHQLGEAHFIERNLTVGSVLEEPVGIPHAWKAIEDTLVLVVTRGPRSGPAYEEDTERLDTPLL